MPRKTNDRALKKSVSFPSSLLRAGEQRARSLGYTLSAYIQHLMRDDLHRKSPGLMRMDEDPPDYPAPNPRGKKRGQNSRSH